VDQPTERPIERLVDF